MALAARCRQWLIAVFLERLKTARTFSLMKVSHVSSVRTRGAESEHIEFDPDEDAHGLTVVIRLGTSRPLCSRANFVRVAKKAALQPSHPTLINPCHCQDLEFLGGKLISSLDITEESLESPQKNHKSQVLESFPGHAISFTSLSFALSI